MSGVNSLVSILLVGSLASILVASEPASPQGNDATAQAESAARLTRMRRRALSLSVAVESASDRTIPVKIIETPLLRYGNQAARIITADATVWAWGETGRPMAIASLDESGLEIVSLADHPVSLTAKSGLKWESARSEIDWKPVPEAPAPGGTPVLRARQMKELAKRFSALGHYSDDSGNTQLRLLERYLHRYSDPGQQIVDGALYALAADTNPEVLLLFECRQSRDTEPQWYYGITRLSAGGLEAKHNGRQVWSCPPIASWDSRKPYWSAAFGKEDTVSDTGPSSAAQP